MEILDLLLLLARTMAMTFFTVEALHLLIYARHSHIYRVYGEIQLMMGALFALTIYSGYFTDTPPLYSGQLNLLWNMIVPVIMVLYYEILLGRRVRWRYTLTNILPFLFAFLFYSVNNNHTFLIVIGWLSLFYATIAVVVLQVMMVKEMRRHAEWHEKQAYIWFAVVMWAMYFSLILRIVMYNLDMRFEKIVTIIVLVAVYAILTFLLRRGMLDFHILQQEEIDIQVPSPVSSATSQPPTVYPVAIPSSVLPRKPHPVHEETDEQPFYMQDQVSFYGDKARQLNELMESKQLYLQPDLSVATLSIELGTNRTYMSNLINQYLHTTFTNYVNDFRVRYAKNLLLTTDDTIEEIFQASGFQSRTTFWRAFAQVEGCTPKEFRRRAVQNNNQPITPNL